MTTPNDRHLPDASNEPDTPPPPRDELDGLLRDWHSQHRERAAAGRDRLLAALAQEPLAGQGAPGPSPTIARGNPRRLFMRPISALAAAAVVLAAILPFILPKETKLVSESLAASNVLMVPEGGKLEARDLKGNLLGPCALKHTDVKADISGRFSRVTVTQTYQNHFTDKIEAVYTFPLSHRAGVDQMTMTIGDRVIEGEVKERDTARRIYEAARDAGRVASLLEQERPNIFTQSVANIEPGATIDIRISYVELLEERDGVFNFEFPTVVAPRYIPGSSSFGAFEVPAIGGPEPDRPTTLKVLPRPGVVLLGPASIRVTERGPGISRSDRGLDERLLNSAVAGAQPVEPPTNADTEIAWFGLEVAYADGSKEPGHYRRDGFGHVGGRWFYCRWPEPAADHPSEVGTPVSPGKPFAKPTDQVPDADRITPMPTHPSTRAGHDLSITVTLDSGGPGILELASPIHKIDRQDLAFAADGSPKRIALTLSNQRDIPNRDFVLSWRQSADRITERVFTHAGEKGGFFAVQLDPPARVSDAQAVPRELIFVVDTSGSMNGPPIALCKQLMSKAIGAMRSQDTFNIMTFAGSTRVLWPSPRPNTPENRAEAMRLIDGQIGSGGTEMMKAIEAALQQDAPAVPARALTLEDLANLPADGREVAVSVDDSMIESDELLPDGTSVQPRLIVRDGLTIACTSFQLPDNYVKEAAELQQSHDNTLRLIIRGTWTTRNGERILDAKSAAMDSDPAVRPLRIVVFLTDAEVGNDMAIIDAIKRHRATTRVFSFGVGNSVNRYLIDEMARAGGGVPEYVYIGETSDTDASSAVERFNRRTQTPVLTDIRVDFEGVQPLELIPDPANIPDLFDQQPLTFIARYVGAANGTMTVRGQTASGPWERVVTLTLHEKQSEHSSLTTIWARAKIDELMGLDLRGIQAGTPNPDVKRQIIALGESFRVLSQFTSFVAVEKVRVTLGGRPRLVHVPVELPDQTNWEGYFGPALQNGGKDRTKILSLTDDALVRLLEPNDGDRELRQLAETMPDILAAAPAIKSADPQSAAPMPTSRGSGTLKETAPASAARPSRPATNAPAPMELASKSPPATMPATKPDSKAPRSGTSSSGEQPIRQSRVQTLRKTTEAKTSGRGLHASDRSYFLRERLGRELESVSGSPQLERAEVRTLAAVQLARSGRIDDARRVVCGGERQPGEAGADIAELCTILSKTSQEGVPNTDLDAFAERATRLLLDARRQELVLSRIAPQLLAKLPATPASTPAADTSGTAMTQLGPIDTGANKQLLAPPVRVVILLSTTDGATLEALAKLGFTLETMQADVRVVIGTISPLQLMALAEHSDVRRIEPLD